MSIHELYDVSILYPTADAAREAFTEVFRTAATNATIAGAELTGLAACELNPVPSNDLDLRLVRAAFDLGQGYIGLKLGVMDQFSLRRMRTDGNGVVDMPDAWGPTGRMREATFLVLDLLELGGHAVLLHKAAAVVKSAGMFRYQAGDLSAERGERPVFAWLDMLASKGDGQPGECRSYGMPHYFGEPNVRAIVPHDDQFCIERTMQALHYTCARIAGGGEAGATISEVLVPVWYLAGRRAPEPAEADAAQYTWSAKLIDNGLMVELRSTELPQRHPWVQWSSGDTLHYDIYTRALSDFLLLDMAEMHMTQVDAIHFDADEERPEARVLVLESDLFVFYATAGLGRVASASGSVEHATVHAELCLFASDHNRILCSVLLNIGKVLLASEVPGGVKDWDSMPPEDGYGFVFVPMNNSKLGNETRPLAMRMLVPLTAAEYGSYRTAEDREAWYRAAVSGPQAVATRWTAFCAHFS